MSEAIVRHVRSVAGGDARITGITAGWLETLGWASGEGTRVRVDLTPDDGSTSVGAAGLQVDEDGTARLFVAMSMIGDPEAAARALDALAWGYCDPSAAVSSNCGAVGTALPTPRPIAVATPRPATLPTPCPVALPRPQPERTPSPRELRRELRALVPWVRGCKAWTRSETANDPFRAGARAAILCEDPGLDVDYIALYRFDRARQIDRYWQRRLDEVRPAVPARGSACQDGRRGVRSWRYGSLACWISPDSGLAALRWTDERTNTYSILTATNMDLANLYREWELLRP